MDDQCDKQLNLVKFIFGEENHELNSRKHFGRTCKKSFLVFMCHFFVGILILACSIVRIMLLNTCEETTIWVAFLSSTVGYILLSSKL